ncbi:EAL domain-containing protein [Thalassotalea ganghwensis]
MAKILQNKLFYLSSLLSFIAVLVVIFSIYAHNKQLVYQIQNQNISDIESQFSFIEDANDQLTIDQLLSKTLRLQEALDGAIPFTMENHPYWILLNIKNTGSQSKNIQLFTDNFILERFDVYQVKGSTVTLKTNVLAGSSNANSFYPNISIALNHQEQHTYYLNIKSSAAPDIPIVLSEESSFAYLNTLTIIVLSAFVSVILIMTLYNLVIYVAVKDNVYLFYIGYLLSTLIVMASINGFGRFLFPETINQWFNHYTLLFHFLLVIFLTLFTIYFLKINIESRRFYQVGILLCIIASIAASIGFFFENTLHAKVFFVLQPLFYIYCVVLILVRLRKDFSWARYYFISWVPLLCGAAIQPLSLLDIIEHNFFTRNAFLFAVFIEITLMAFALAERMRRLEKERLYSIQYHSDTGLPQKVNLENTLERLIDISHASITVMTIKPEHIDRVALYLSQKEKNALIKTLFFKLAALYRFNDAILFLTEQSEKIVVTEEKAFVVLIDVKRLELPIEQLIQSTKDVVRQNFLVDKLNLPLSAIIGLANYPDHGDNARQIINNAFLAQNIAEQTPHQWQVFHPQKVLKNNNTLQLAKALYNAINNNELALFHQPQIDLNTNRVCSSECLLRWQTSQGDYISPDVFIPIAEDMGLIYPLTKWVIKTALTQQHHIINELGFNHMISINISGKDISRTSFFIDVVDIIEASGVSADKIIFELTETTSIANNLETIALLEKLTEIGITISIDDFGTGYSSMTQVSTLPFQELKVDRHFVENICANQKRKIITRSTVEMAKGLGLEVVAEGINSQEDEDTLRKFGCDIGQGYFYAKPMSFEDYSNWLENLDKGRIKPTPPMPAQEFIPATKTKD